jgi:hypothetical protein
MMKLDKPYIRLVDGTILSELEASEEALRPILSPHSLSNRE